ncbi:MAG: RHS repeat protein, partial [bacterium]|nr:RHS repeat protein [bacterium]
VSTVKRNDAGQVYQEIDAAGNTEDYWYEDLRGNMTRRVETEKKPDGSEETYETKYQYNAFNKIEKITDPLGNETTLTYDVKGSLTGSKDAEGNTISHKYDVFGRKKETIKHLKNGQKIETAFEYYKNNNIKSITDANSNKTSYEYDNQGRTQKITYPDNTFLEYTYDGNSNIKTIKQRNGTVVTNSYDGLNRLFHRTVASSEEVEGTTFEDYEYDGLSRLTKAVNDFSTVEMKYDWMDRLTEETQNGKLLKYTYDKMNNLKSIQYPNQRIIERDFDVLNRIWKIKEGSNTIADYSYIGRSYRLLKKQYGNGDVIDYLYDQGKRLTSKETKN